MNYRDWYVGMKVVCVDACGHYGLWPMCDDDMDGLREGAIYTIRKMGLYRGQLAIWLKEIKRSIRGTGAARYGECGYSAQRFRPVQPRKTDISCFRAMLTGSKQKEPA